VGGEVRALRQAQGERVGGALRQAQGERVGGALRQAQGERVGNALRLAQAERDGLRANRYSAVQAESTCCAGSVKVW